MKHILLFGLSITLFINDGFSQMEPKNSNKSNVQESTQDTNKLYLIKKTDGGEFIGEIISDDGREVLIMTKSIGKVYIRKENISLITQTNETKKLSNDEVITGEFRAEGPFTTRYYFTNNALPIKKGENYALINLFGPEVHFAVSDKLSLGFIASWIGSPITAVSKFSILSKNKVHLSVGNIIGSSGYLAQGRAIVGLHWGTLTIGDRMRNISFSAGYGYFSDKSYIITNFGDSFHDALFIGFGGISPVGKKASFILDGMFISNTRDNRSYDPQNTNNPWRNTTDPTITNTTLILMPGMRFYSSYDKAFQISLAGVFFTNRRFNRSIYNSDGTSTFKSGEVTSFPVPTISWLRKF